MAAYIAIRPAGGTWVVRAGGAVIGESQNALELIEGDMPPVVYFPSADIATAFLEPSETRAQYPLIGASRYFDIATQAGALTDAAWTFDAPNEGLEAIAGYVAFFPGKVTVEQL